MRTAFCVSVVVPTYNRANLIGATLDSVLAQSHPATEIIVVDDGSTDGTEDLVRTRYPSIIYRKLPNSGAPRARNVGVEASHGEWIAFLDSDDLWEKEKLARHAAFFAAVPEVEYAFSNFTIMNGDALSGATKFDELSKSFFEGFQRVGSSWHVSRTPLYERLLSEQPVFPSCVLMTRRFFETTGGWEESLGRCQSEDLEFTLRCVRNVPIGILDEPLVRIRKHAGNFSGDHVKLIVAEVEILNYAKRRHGVTASTRLIIEREISRRSKSCADLAFADCQFQLTRRLLENVAPSDIGPKQRMKRLISALPYPAARFLARALVR